MIMSKLTVGKLRTALEGVLDGSDEEDYFVIYANWIDSIEE